MLSFIQNGTSFFLNKINSTCTVAIAASKHTVKNCQICLVISAQDEQKLFVKGPRDSFIPLYLHSFPSVSLSVFSLSHTHSLSSLSLFLSLSLSFSFCFRLRSRAEAWKERRRRKSDWRNEEVPQKGGENPDWNRDGILPNKFLQICPRLKLKACVYSEFRWIQFFGKFEKMLYSWRTDHLYDGVILIATCRGVYISQFFN